MTYSIPSYVRETLYVLESMIEPQLQWCPSCGSLREDACCL